MIHAMGHMRLRSLSICSCRQKMSEQKIQISGMERKKLKQPGDIWDPSVLLFPFRAKLKTPSHPHTPSLSPELRSTFRPTPFMNISRLPMTTTLLLALVMPV